MSDNNEPESAPAPSNPEETGRPALVERPAEPRCELRSPRHYRIFFTTDLVEGEGTILNIGKDGCKVECETPVEVDATLEAWLFLPDFEWPVRIERAKVVWHDGDVFGLEFIDLRPAQRERLRKFLQPVTVHDRRATVWQ